MGLYVYFLYISCICPIYIYMAAFILLRHTIWAPSRAGTQEHPGRACYEVHPSAPVQEPAGGVHATVPPQPSIYKKNV